MNGTEALQSRRARLSPAKLALLEKHLRGAGAARRSPGEIKRLAASEAPLSFGQQRLWFLSRVEPESALYNLGFLLRIRGGLDIPAVRGSLERIVARHEILRTRFSMNPEGLRQCILAHGQLDFATLDPGPVPTAQDGDELEELAKRIAEQPFDLAEGPLLRVRLAKLDDAEHMLVLVLHHSIADAWSLRALVREFAALYPALRDGCAPTLPELPVQYADYAVWQRQRLTKEALDRHLAYWRERLAGMPPALELPTTHSRPAQLTTQGAVFCLDLKRPLVAGLQELGRRHGATLFMTLAAAFNALLHRYTGQTDLCIGYPVANRPAPELEDLIGFFVSTLVLRTDLGGNPRFGALLARVRQSVLSDQAHQELPFEKLVEELKPARQAGRNPLFQVMLVLQNAFSGSLELGGLEVEARELRLPVAKFDLVLSIAEREGDLGCVFEYSTELFEEPTIARMAGHWQELLNAIVSNPDARLSELPMLTEAERRQLARWNGADPRSGAELLMVAGAISAEHTESCDALPEPISRVEQESKGLLHVLFESRAARSPKAPALVHNDQTLSYGELERRANRLACALRQRGIGPERHVALHLDPGLEMIIAMLATLKAGAAYVPIDPSYPVPRRNEVLADSGAAFVVTRSGRTEHPFPRGVESILLDQEAIAEQASHRPGTVCDADNAAYLLYTSGSTGRPKGVVVSHRNAVHSTAARLTYYAKPVRSFLLLSSYAFDSSVAGIFWTLSQGGRLCIPSESERRDPSALLCLIARAGVSHLLCLPSLYGLLLEQARSGQLASLETVIVAGEACPTRIAASHFSKLPSADLYNEYGPTEGTVWSSVHTVRATDGRSERPLSIGRPVGGMRIYLLDAQLAQVPAGVPGEIYIGGPGVARGYHRRPEVSAERFLPDPFAGQTGSRMYRSGDLARYREGGTLEFLGRVDHQVKIRGHRIEPGEIEARLLSHPDVQEAVVLAREDRPGDRRLVAYLVFREGTEASRDPDTKSGFLRQALKTTLPEHMVPSVFVVLESMPKTPNGKLDRQALPVPDWRAQSRYAAPRNEREELLVAIWADVLGTERMGIHDNFFELGGDSILAIQMIGRANQSGLVLRPRQLFQHQTVAELARVTGSLRRVDAEQGPDCGEIPLLPIQHWFFDRKLPNPHHWNQSVLLEVGAGVGAELLEQAVNGLIAHHDALRMRFREERGFRVQNCLAEEPHSSFHRVDLSGLPEEAQAERIKTECARWQASLHLAEGPLLRAVFFESGGSCKPRMLIVIHHLVVDGVSWRILIEDLDTACCQRSQNRPLMLPAKTTSFKEWSKRLSDFARSESLLRALDHWSNTDLSRVRPVPVDDPDGAASEGTTEIIPVALDRDDTRSLLEGLPAERGLTIRDWLVTALAVTLGAWTDSDTVLIGLEGHGRENLFDDVDLSRTVGWFTSLYPQLLHLTPGASGIECVERVAAQLASTPDHGIAYGVGRYLRGMDDSNRHLQAFPKPQVVFNYFGQFHSSHHEGTGLISLLEGFHEMDFAPEGERVAELGVDARVLDGRLRIEWSYSRARHHRETIERLAQAHLDYLKHSMASIETLRKARKLSPEAQAAGEPYRTVLADIALEDAIHPGVWQPSDALNPKAVLLTGGTGFVGAFLLRELLDRTAAAVYCPVRAKDADEARARLERNMAQNGLSFDCERVVPLIGDLSMPNLGLSEADFEELSLKLDAIYHNGASPNLVQPYSAVRQANVAGTKEIIRLSCRNGFKPIHYVSTLSVFGEARSETGTPFSEDDVPELGPWLSMGYAQSKWAAEALLRLAGKHGCPVVIYRLGTVTGHSRTGTWNTDDYQYRLLETSIGLGGIPKISDTVDMTPVDYVAQALGFLSLRAESVGKTFHLVNPDPIRLGDFAALLSDLGYPVRTMAFGEWTRKISILAGRSPKHPLYPFLAILDRGDENGVEQRSPVLEQRFGCAKHASGARRQPDFLSADRCRSAESIFGVYVRRGILRDRRITDHECPPIGGLRIFETPDMKMNSQIKNLISEKSKNTPLLHRRHLNAQMVNVVELLGYERNYTKALGQYLYDAEEKQYLDLLGGFGVFAVGRNHPGLVAVLQETLGAQLPNLVQMSLSTLAGVLAEKLAAVLPVGLDKVLFCNSGTEAVEAAIKFSRYFTGRPGIVYCEDAFHGMTLGSLSLASDADLRVGFEPLLPDCHKIPFNDLGALERALHGRQIAAFIVEPLQGKGVVLPQEAYLSEAQRLCAHHGTLFVADEVQTGLGRTGSWWAVEHWQVEPDLLLMAKALSGGFVPVGAVAMKKTVMDKVYSGVDRAYVHGSTFSKNNLAMAAGIATLDILQGEDLIDHAALMGASLLKGLAETKTPDGPLKEVRGKGLMIGLEFGRPAADKGAARWNEFESIRPGLFAIALTCVLLERHRLLSQVSDARTNLIKWMPCLGISEADCRWAKEALASVIQDAEQPSGAVWRTGFRLVEKAMRLDAPAEGAIARSS